MILITRPIENSDETAKALMAMGHEIYCEPMLTIFPLADDEDELDVAIFTSGSSVACIPETLVDLQPIVVAVGDRTAEKAKKRGFQTVSSTDGNVQDLLQWICANIPKDKKIVHFCGQDHVGDLVAHLKNAGFMAKEKITYMALPQMRFTKDLENKLNQGVIRSALFFSPRTAKVFMENVKSYGLLPQLADLKAFCLSQAVSNCLPMGSWKKILVAEAPTQASLFKLIESEYR